MREHFQIVSSYHKSTNHPVPKLYSHSPKKPGYLEKKEKKEKLPPRICTQNG